MPLFSIVVPVYKAEKYIEKCVSSILSQTITDYELILVDDGSPDRSGKLCDKYSEKYSFIKTIHKKNGGLVSARKAGAAEMTETTVDWELVSDCQSKVPVRRLNQLLMDHARQLDAPQQIPYREQTGSTDFGNVLHRVPGGCIRVAFVPEGTSSHSQAWLDAGKSPALHSAALMAAKVLAMTAWDLACNPGLRREIQEEFAQNLAKEQREAT